MIISYKASVKKDIKKLNDDIKNNIKVKIETDLKTNPGKDKKLTDKKNIYSYRVGDYRVIYTIIGEIILILRIGHRKHMYKR